MSGFSIKCHNCGKMRGSVYVEDNQIIIACNRCAHVVMEPIEVNKEWALCEILADLIASEAARQHYGRATGYRFELSDGKLIIEERNGNNVE